MTNRFDMLLDERQKLGLKQLAQKASTTMKGIIMELLEAELRRTNSKYRRK